MASTSDMSRVTLPASLVKRILDKHPSVMQEAYKEDQNRKEDIASERCPKCDTPLTPRLARDPNKIFRGTKINYTKWCSSCDYEED